MLAIIAVLTLLGAGLRFSTLGLQSFWYDEAVTQKLVSEPFLDMLRAIPRSEATPPLYYILLWPWVRVFGKDEWGLRSLSALVGTISVPVAFLTGRAFVSRRTGIVMAALVAVSPFLVWYSQEARAYALVSLFGTVSLLFFARALERPTRKNLGGWLAAAVLALLTHYFAIFLIVAEAVWLIGNRTTRSAARAPTVALTFAVLAIAILARSQFGDSRTSWIDDIQLKSRVRNVASEFTAGRVTFTHELRLIAVGALALLALLFFITRRRERDRGSLALVIGAIALLTPLLLAVLGIDYFLARYLITAWTPLAIVVGTVLGSARIGAVGAALSLGLVILSIIASVIVFRDSNLQRDDWRGATRVLGDLNRSRIIITTPQYERIPIHLYRPSVRSLPRTGAVVQEIVLVAVAGFTPFQRYRLPADFRLFETRTIQHMRLVRYRSARPRRVTPADVLSEKGRLIDPLLEQP